MPQAPILESSFSDTYVTHEYVKLGVEPSPTLRLVTQAIVVCTWALTMRAPTLEGPPRRACHSRRWVRLPQENILV
jgi:hypothetical protein